MKLVKQIGKFQANIVAVFVYFVYLLSLPNIVSLFVDCLDRFSDRPHEFEECTVSLATDKFLLLSFGGFAIVILGLFFWRKKLDVKMLVITAAVMAVMAIAAFYIYIPIVRESIFGTQIYLDSV